MTTLTSPLEEYLEALLAGDRQNCRSFIARQLQAGKTAEELLHDVLWPSLVRVDELYRADRINMATEHMAVRVNRCISAQVQMGLPYRTANGKRILIASAEGEMEEIAGQVVADLFEARGWEVHFIGGGVPDDEVLSLVGQLRPDIFLICGTKPQGAPRVRATIDLIREVGANPNMNVLVIGGVFNRADGLWKEVNADLFARTPQEAIELAEAAEARKPELRIPGAPKKRRRRRPSPILAQASTD